MPQKKTSWSCSHMRRNTEPVTAIAPLQVHKHSVMRSHLRLFPALLINPGPCHPRVLKYKTCQSSAHFIPIKAAPIRPFRLRVPNSPTSNTHNSTQPSVAQLPQASPVPGYGHVWTASTALAGMQPTNRDAACAGLGPFPRPAPTVLPMVRFGLPTPPRHATLHNADSDLMHHQFRVSLLQWNPGPARKNPTQILQAMCGRFHVVILHEGSGHAPLVSDQFATYTGGTDHLAMLLNRNTFEPDAAVAVVNEPSSSKDTWRMVVRGLLRHPSLLGIPTVTFCSVHIHNVVAKKARCLDLSPSSPTCAHVTAQC